MRSITNVQIEIENNMVDRYEYFETILDMAINNETSLHDLRTLIIGRKNAALNELNRLTTCPVCEAYQDNKVNNSCNKHS